MTNRNSKQPLGVLLVFAITSVMAGCLPLENKTDAIQQKGVISLSHQSRLADAEYEAGNWLSHGRTYAEQRYSPLHEINQETIGELKLAWYVDLPGKRGQEATPLVIDGVMYTSSAWSHVLALEAATGKQLWHFDPKVPKSTGVKGCCDAVNRGVAFMDGRIFVGTLDGRLIALDAKTGDQLWSIITVDQEKNYTITGAPRVANGKVFIGNGGAEYGVRGYLSAYDANSGDLVWRFYTVPGAPGEPVGTEPVEAQTATWNGNWWKFGGGGTVWDSMAFDAETNLLYFGVGNGSPWNPNIRTAGAGDNLFLSSIVAVDADTGIYRWHYQTTPGEAWDFTATQHMILADMDIAGKPRKVLMQAPKNGFFYVLDRISGELISAEPFVKVTWASHVDKISGRPVVNPEAEYWKTGKPALVSPSWMGGHNWHPMSYSSDTGLVYFPAQETAFPYLAEDEQTPSKLAVNLGVDTKVASFPDDPAVIAAIKKATSGRLVAWNPVTQKEVWRVEYPGAWNGGVLTTAGELVFQGSATGFLNAYAAKDGKKLWEFPAQTGVVAPPISFEVDGEQYISVSAGWGGIFPLMTGPLVLDAAAGDPINRSRILTFKLGGTAELPMALEQMRDMPDLSKVKLDATMVEKGVAVYDRYCVNCHGAGAVGGGVIPDLRYSAMLSAPQVWQQVVLDGILSDRGMVSFAAELSSQDAEAARHYVITRNQFAQKIGDTKRLSR
ncbi:MAG: PQQ-dependent dehydrogenase, methanol/ethanol family [Pseudomonadales bacterium]